MQMTRQRINNAYWYIHRIKYWRWCEIEGSSN